jgi:hypothetical protein
VILKPPHFDLKLFDREILHLNKWAKLLSNYPENVLPVLVLMLCFLGLYLLLGAFLITKFQVDYVTSPPTPPACDPPDALLRMAPRSNIKGSPSLCT